ncbi:carbon-nitrogen hydrolase [Aspergillus steynii IBT 23096]|uniref:Carbon-nitrogen hydrolase n=1 Tax=Aspergillus steynii IBT 23096 TaxID=1392250 RepID=A0A2I2FTB0_9EURO|nr:carbon-nitrogen hydrolase [Aspergillus steynii IBT 23096]PLB43854.1 carbon-nitrogen hydrolase [Aspergillus steynii IBT 23096]
MPLRIAACHVSPVFLSARDSTTKAISLMKQAARQNANLIVFPETYISAFPIWSALRPPTDNHAFFERMAQESVYADGDEIQTLRATARTLNLMVSIGVSEKVRHSSATLFNANLLISPTGDVLIHHRKLVPTFFEKLTWAPGDGHGLRVADTPFGKIGNLICGENTNPLARYALMAQGEQIHLSTWPAIWPTRVAGPSVEEADKGGKVDEKPNYDNVAANRTRAAAHCFEAKCFGVLCAGVLGADAIEAIAEGSAHLKQVMERAQRGATMFLDPTGAPLRGFTVDEAGEHRSVEYLQASEGILYADVDVKDCVEGKQYHDVVGGYQRMDVFDLKVDRTRRDPVTFTEIAGQAQVVSGEADK